MIDWIKVEDKLPSKDLDEVIVWVEKGGEGYCGNGQFRKDGDMFLMGSGGFYISISKKGDKLKDDDDNIITHYTEINSPK